MGKRAVSLLELLISMVLLSLLASTVFGVFAIMGKGPANAGILQLQAINFARETSEKLREAVSTDAARSGPLTAGTDISDPLPAGSFRDTSGGTRLYDVVDVDANDDGETDYKKVTVTVRWND